MTAEILYGKPISESIRNEITEQTASFVKQHGITPCLAAVLVGNDPASQVYVRNKEKACEQAGIKSRMHRLPATTTTNELLGLIKSLNEDKTVHGILVQLPLPVMCDTLQVLDAISPLKDVDAFHPENVGLISQARPRYLPCTPAGIQQILIRNNIKTSGKKVVILGRSDIVGKPMALMMVQKAEGANATVTICHSQTENLPEVTRTADILIVAIGKAKFVTNEMVKPSAVVIDVGINRQDEKIVGDVDFDAVKDVASAITPVPGGVGLLTIAMLMQNTLTAARLQTI
jgi:methylenetetrahydrofolate dehydrogenase (NADP+)/methenyltetrahydrofolate cyclohydrolase